MSRKPLSKENRIETQSSKSVRITEIVKNTNEVGKFNIPSQLLIKHEEKIIYANNT